MPWLYVTLLFSHYYLPSILARGIFRTEDKTLLVGSSRKAQQLGEWLQRKSEIGLRTVGLICEEDIDKTQDGIPVLGKPNEIEKVIVDQGITQVILLEFPLFANVYQNVIQTCDQLGIRLFILSDLEERLHHSVRHFEDGGFRFIGLREEPLENPLNRFAKRAIDFAIALPVMLIVFPVLAVIVFVAQRLQSPGPLFHVQERAGMQNRQFEIFKFRTMHSNNGEISRQARLSRDPVLDQPGLASSVA